MTIDDICEITEEEYKEMFDLNIAANKKECKDLIKIYNNLVEDKTLYHLMYYTDGLVIWYERKLLKKEMN